MQCRDYFVSNVIWFCAQFPFLLKKFFLSVAGWWSPHQHHGEGCHSNTMRHIPSVFVKFVDRNALSRTVQCAVVTDLSLCQWFVWLFFHSDLGWGLQLLIWTFFPSSWLRILTTDRAGSSMSWSILVNVLVESIVDASAYTFTVQTVIVLFASLKVIFNERFTLSFSAWTSHALLSVCHAADHEGRILVDWVWKYHEGETIRTKAYASFCFVLRGCPHDYRHFNVEGRSIPQKVKGVVLDIDADCSIDNVFFMELFVGLVQKLIDSLFRVTKFPRLSCACTWQLLCFLSWHPKCDE